MTTAKVFTTGRSQAVRLPKECRFAAKEVCVAKVGDMVILYPRGKGRALLERGIRSFTEDFMADRNQPAEADKRADL
jgi:antitoxin VapB